MTLTFANGQTLQGKAGAATALVVTVYGGEQGATTYSVLARVTLTTSASTILTANGATIVKKIVVQSIHAADQTVELWVNGNADANRWYKGVVKAGGANHPIEGVRLDANGTPLSYELNPGSGGGGAAVPVQENGTPVTAAPTAINFLTGFDVSDVSGVATIDIDETELTGIPESSVTNLVTDLAAKQAADATLTSLSALGTAADRVAYTTGVDTWAETPLTTAGRALIDDADAAAQRATLSAEARPTLDTHANRVAAAHVAGRFWRETDTGLTYYDNGTTWDIWTADGTVRKTANETVNNSSTNQDDDHLFWPVEPNEVWFFEAFLLLSGASVNADWKFGLRTTATGSTASWHTGGTAGSWNQVGAGTTPGFIQAIGGAPTIGGGAGTGLSFLAGWVAASSTAGTVWLQWAQATPTAENNTILANSFMRLRRLV